MEIRFAKELLHIRRWLGIAASIVANGRDAYETDAVAQEAGDSLMIKRARLTRHLSHTAAMSVTTPAVVIHRPTRMIMATPNHQRPRPSGVRYS